MNNSLKYSISTLGFWFCLFSFLFYSTKIIALNCPIALPNLTKIETPCPTKSIAAIKIEAILILPGFGDKRKRRKKQRAFFEQFNYDIFIADYHSRKSFDLTVEEFTAYYESNHLKDYEKIHVFAYILGSWVINEYIKKNGRQNICTIIYDRSPLQELAPKIVVDKLPLLGKLSKGKVLAEFSKLPYPPLAKDSIKIGIIVESKATRLVRLYKKKALSYGELSWHPSSFQQRYNDLFYTPLNHDQMYFRFDVIGEELIHFIEYGTFSDKARRVCFDWDVFEKWKG